jgi:hypothetical protein
MTHNFLTILPQLLHLVLPFIVPLLQCGDITVLLFDPGLELPEFNQNTMSIMTARGKIHTASVR